MGSVDWGEVVVIVIGALTTLLAAFLGAWFAFRLQAKGDAVKVRAGQIQDANLNLSFLADQIQQVSAILEHLVPEGVPDESRHYVIKPIVPDSNVQFLKLDLDSLAFAIAAHPALVSDLSSLQRDINTALGLVKSRSQLHIDFLQPAVEALQARHGGEKVPDNFHELIKEQLGFRRDFELRDATDRMINGLALAHDCAHRGFDLLSEATKVIYPDAVLVPKPAT